MEKPRVAQNAASAQLAQQPAPTPAVTPTPAAAKKPRGKRHAERVKTESRAKPARAADARHSPTADELYEQLDKAERSRSKASTQARTCCKHCSSGIPCGNSCISASKTCHQPPGCAC